MKGPSCPECRTEMTRPTISKPGKPWWCWRCGEYRRGPKTRARPPYYPARAPEDDPPAA